MNLWYIPASISAIIPVLLIKEYSVSDNKNVLFLVLSMVCYLGLMISYINIFNTDKVSSSYTIIQLLQLLLVVLFGILFFKEKINLLGLFFACLAIYYLK
jgi:multidrug transporter EmrE-like cation transporter